MHNNFFFLRQLADALERNLKHSVVRECFTQNKDELVVVLSKSRKETVIKASLSPTLSSLSFPERFHRAARNSVDIFGSTLGQRVLKFTAIENDRSMLLVLDGHQALLYKMHGTRSNVILLSDDKVTSLFKNKFKSDIRATPEHLSRSIDWTRASFLKHCSSARKYFNPLGKPVWDFLEAKGFDKLESAEQADLFEETITALQSPRHYYVTEINRLPCLQLLETGKVLRIHSDPVKAVTDFFNIRATDESFTRERNRLIGLLERRVASATAYVTNATKKLGTLQSDDRFRVWANLVMANLANIPAHADLVTLSSFENASESVSIKLNPALTPQKNAEGFYRKARNKSIEIKQLQDTIARREEILQESRALLGELQHASDLSELNPLTEKVSRGKTVRSTATALPYREVEFKGFAIRIGRNARSNDELTLRYSHKEDLWLHARDVSGSHVIVKAQGKKPIPGEVVLRAASLAAWYSKRKTDSLCPVSVVKRKYVTKRKSDPPGMVRLLREEVVMVEPAG